MVCTCTGRVAVYQTIGWYTQLRWKTYQAGPNLGPKPAMAAAQLAYVGRRRSASLRGSAVVESLLRRDAVERSLESRGGTPVRRGTLRGSGCRDLRSGNPERDKWVPGFGTCVMAREHHCPNCGAQPCNASTSKIHTCGMCAAIWEEDLSAPLPAQAAPRPAVPSPAPAVAAAPAPPKPAAPPPVPPKPAPTPATGTPAAMGPAAAKPVTQVSPPATPTATPPAAPTPRGPSAAPAPSVVPRPAPTVPPTHPATTPGPASQPAALSATGEAKTLAEVLQGAKVKRCPGCQSDGVAQPGDFAMVRGRLVLVDSQTYRAHQWYADTGELLPPAAGAPASAPRASAPAARANPAT